MSKQIINHRQYLTIIVSDIIGDIIQSNILEINRINIADDAYAYMLTDNIFILFERRDYDG